MRQKQIDALSFAIGAVMDMHGSVVGDPSFPHDYTPEKCSCAYGVCIRALTMLRSDLYKALRSERKRKFDFSDLRTGSEEKVKP